MADSSKFSRPSLTSFFIVLFAFLLFFVNSGHTIAHSSGDRYQHKGKRHNIRKSLVYHSSAVEAVPRVQGYTSKYWRPELAYNMKSGTGTDILKPYFDESTNRNVTTTTLKPAYLHCRVRNLGGRTVSWIRKKDLHILTVGAFSYTKDDRYSTMHMDNSDDWTLEIRYPEKEDEGIYECQVSTVPKISLKVQLNVVEAKAKILGGPSLYLNSGSNIKLNCVIKDSPVGGPEYVFWHHNGNAIDYDSARGEVNLLARKSTTTSILFIKNAKVSDTGNYSCNPSNASPATINVHVIDGEYQAAMQDVNQNSSENSPRTAGGGQMLSTVSLLVMELFLIDITR